LFCVWVAFLQIGCDRGHHLWGGLNNPPHHIHKTGFTGHSGQQTAQIYVSVVIANAVNKISGAQYTSSKQQRHLRVCCAIVQKPQKSLLYVGLAIAAQGSQNAKSVFNGKKGQPRHPKRVHVFKNKRVALVDGKNQRFCIAIDGKKIWFVRSAL